MTSLPIPDALIDYFSRHVEDLFGGLIQLFRYFSPAESALWVGYDGFEVQRAHAKKMSATAFPVLLTVGLAEWRAGFVGFMYDVLQSARAVPYTYYDDPITGDPLYAYEYEFSVYGVAKPGSRAPPVERISTSQIDFARLLRYTRISEKDLKRAKVLPTYVHGRAYARHSYTLVPHGKLAKWLAVAAVLYSDLKMRWAFGWAWDKHWEERDLIAFPPSYLHAEGQFELYRHTPPDYRTVETVCYNSHIPDARCEALKPGVAEEVRRLYSLVGVEVAGLSYAGPPRELRYSREGWELYGEFPDIFEDPEQAEATLKWWCGSREDLVRELRGMRARRYGRAVSPEEDPEVVVEDGWEP